MNRFTRAREIEGYVRCVRCKRIHHKDGCWRCEDCGVYSCTKCDMCLNAFLGTFCRLCIHNDVTDQERDEALDAVHFDNIQGLK